MSNHGALLESEVFEDNDKMARKVGFEGLYYITHIDNVISILQRGILSHRRIAQGDINFTPIDDSAIISNRQESFR
jgi:ssDNA thymidine ADP-ribosyltransferase, DarT